jgi:putative CocE/NonD family hydrolase
VDFGPQAAIDVVAESISWFDRFLAKKPEETAKPFPTVRYFVMGENAWRTSSSWPPAEATMTAFYLHSQGKANTRGGNGRLDRQAPGPGEPVDMFQADPADPVLAAPAYGKEYREINGPTNQAKNLEHPNVLVYASEPATENLTFAGPIRAELYVAADTPDADWVVSLIDLHPDGFAQPLATGIQRASFRDSEEHPSPLEPGKVYSLMVDMGHSAARISPGHRLVVLVTGSWFPLYDRNTNTGDGPSGSRTLVATEQVWHTTARPSKIALPLLEQ